VRYYAHTIEKTRKTTPKVERTMIEIK